MSDSFFGRDQTFGSPELRLPDDLQEPLRRHLEELRNQYLQMNWATRVGFGKRPALLVIDLALFWTQPGTQMGSNVDSVVQATCRILEAARSTQIPIFFSTYDFDPDELPNLVRPGKLDSVVQATCRILEAARSTQIPIFFSTYDFDPDELPNLVRPGKLVLQLNPDDAPLLKLDPRLQRRLNEKLLPKKYASCFKGTNLLQMLASLGVDTLIITGVSTSHCVYATCRDARESFRVIVAREGVGERCQIMHMVNLLDIDIDLGDVVQTQEIVTYLQEL